MTNELEKQFFATFAIEPKTNQVYGVQLDYHIDDYPQITDHLLLELICIVLNVFETFEVNRIMDVDSLKEKILKLSMLAKDDVYSQVRTLFKEG